MKYLAAMFSLLAIMVYSKSVLAAFDESTVVGDGTKIKILKPIELGLGEHKAAFAPCSIGLLLWGAEVPSGTSCTLAPQTLTVGGRDSNGKWLLLYGAARTIVVNCPDTTVGGIQKAFGDLIGFAEVVPAEVPADTLEVGAKN